MREDFHGRVAASHCGAMAGYNDVYAAKVIDMVATAGITISVNAHINLVCSARLDREPRRRGIARVKELLARGVNVVSSQDDVDDPVLSVRQARPARSGADDGAYRATDAAARAGAGVRHGDGERRARGAAVPTTGSRPAASADLVVLGAPSVREALRLQQPRPHVIKDGREIARTTRDARAARL